MFSDVAWLAVGPFLHNHFHVCPKQKNDRCILFGIFIRPGSPHQISGDVSTGMILNITIRRLWCTTISTCSWFGIWVILRRSTTDQEKQSLHLHQSQQLQLRTTCKVIITYLRKVSVITCELSLCRWGCIISCFHAKTYSFSSQEGSLLQVIPFQACLKHVSPTKLRLTGSYS